MRITLLAVAIALLMGGSVPATAMRQVGGQLADLPEGVTFEPDRTTVQPGASVAYRVIGTSGTQPPVMSVLVPDELELVGEPTCSAEAWIVPPDPLGGIGRPEMLGCSGTIDTDRTDGHVELETISGSASGGQTVLYYNLFLDLRLRVPPTAVPGTVYTLRAPILGLDAQEMEATLEVLNAAGERVPLAPTAPAASPSAVPTEASVTELVISASEVSAAPGETISLNLEVPRLQGITGVAFLASASGMGFNNLPRFLADESGTVACNADNSGDVVPPIERPQSPGPDFPPRSIDLTVSPQAKPGDVLTVCVEMIGFADDVEVFAWNRTATIEVTA